MGGDDEFSILIGHARQGREESFASQVARAVRKAGHTGTIGGSPRTGRSTLRRGRTAFTFGRLFGAERRVIVKDHIARQGRVARSAPLSAHIAYLERDGVTRDGAHAHMFSGYRGSRRHQGVRAALRG